jgi:hypothetical protein
VWQLLPDFDQKFRRCVGNSYSTRFNLGVFEYESASQYPAEDNHGPFDAQKDCDKEN